LINAEGSGIVEYVDANEIVIRYDWNSEDKLVSFESEVTRYSLIKFMKTNQSTCINLKPIVEKGDKVVKVKFFVKVMQLKKENCSWSKLESGIHAMERLQL
jgi:DNA-directed RNA polymerase beta subunit